MRAKNLNKNKKTMGLLLLRKALFIKETFLEQWFIDLKRTYVCALIVLRVALSTFFPPWFSFHHYD